MLQQKPVKWLTVSSPTIQGEKLFYGRIPAFGSEKECLIYSG